MRSVSRILILVATLGLCLTVGVGVASAYTVVCNDGTLSQAGGKQGACSHHGGVAGPSSGGGGTTPTTPTPVAPPVDATPPTVQVEPFGGPWAYAVGAALSPPGIRVSDNVAWAYSAAGYAVSVAWGDGLVESVSFTGVSSASLGVRVAIPRHVYTSPGTFHSTVTVTDPAGNTTTQPLANVAVAPAIEAPEGYPVLAGTARAGRLLTCDAGLPDDWGDPAARLRIHWLVNGNVLYGYGGDTFRVRNRDRGRVIRCQVTVSNQGSRSQGTSNALRIKSAVRHH